MAYYFYINWSELKNHDWHFEISLFLLSLFLLWLAISSYIYAMNISFKSLINRNIGFSQMYKIVGITNIGRYIPGKLWNILGFFYYIGEYGVNKKQATLAIMGTEVSSKGAALILGLGYFFFSLSYRNYLPIMITLLVASLIIIHPRILKMIINPALRLLKKESIEVGYKYSTILKLVFLYLIV
jgi:hypothetical protein